MKSNRKKLANAYDTIRKAGEAIRRIARVDFVTWLELYFYLAPASSATEGLMKLYYWQRGPTYSMADPRITVHAEKKPVQMGATKRLVAYFLYAATVLRRNGCIYQPTTDDANDFSVTQLGQALEYCPEAAKHLKVVDLDRKDKDNTAKRRVFRGAILYVRHATTEATFRRITVDDVAADDYDAMGLVSGSTVKVKSFGRTDASVRPKQIIQTSPKRAEESQILEVERAIDTRLRPEYPCPCCGEYQELVLAPLADPRNMQLDEQKWSWGLMYDIEADGSNQQKSRASFYRCRHCLDDFGYDRFVEIERKCRWVSDNGYMQSNEDGKWYALGDWEGTEIDPPRDVFYAYNGLLKRDRLEPPDNVWQQLVMMWLNARDELKTGNEAPMVGLVTEKLGIEYYSNTTDEYPQAELISRLEEYGAECPPWVQRVVLSVDYQGTYADWTAWGWGAKYECAALDTGVIPGNPGDENSPMWRDLDRLSDRVFTKASSEQMRIDVEIHDKGYKPREVEKHCAKRHRTRIAAKGDSNDPLCRPVTLPQRPDRHALCYVAKLGVHQLAAMLYTQLEIRKPEDHEEGDPIPGYIHVPHIAEKFYEIDTKTGEVRSDFWEQMTAEQLVYELYRKKKRAFYRCPEGRRNEKHDCWRMARAGADILVHRMGKPLLDDYMPPVSAAVSNPSAVGGVASLADMVNG